MTQLDNQPDNHTTGDVRASQDALKAVTQELKRLQQELSQQLDQDITRLQAEKFRLIEDIDQLRGQHKQLQAQNTEYLSGQQIAQQQRWVKQLAQVLATHLQERLTERLDQITSNSAQSIAGSYNGPFLPPIAPTRNYNEDAYRLLASLDATLSTTFRTLEQELSSYQSALSQQLGRMHSLERQGEAILETLVNRLITQIQVEVNSNRLREYRDSQLPQAIAPPITAPPVAAPPAAPAPEMQSTAFTRGLLLILLSSITLSFQNVVTRIILKEKTILGLVKLGGFISPSPGNSLLILVMRLALVAPIMAFILAPRIYPNTWRDIRNLGKVENRAKLWSVLGSGFFLFLSQFFIYIALGNIPTGVATTIFFVYPTITILLAWLIFADRPTFLLALATATIYIGGYLTIPNFSAGAQGDTMLGAATAIASGISFAAYVILIKVAKMHPAPFSVVNFTTIFVLATATLPIFGYKVNAGMWPQLCAGIAVLSVTTLVGYLLNNFGVPLIGPALAAVVGASGPAFTAIMALLFINETLVINQWLGVFLVTLWVLGISVENLKKNQPPPKPSAAK